MKQEWLRVSFANCWNWVTGTRDDFYFCTFENFKNTKLKVKFYDPKPFNAYNIIIINTIRWTLSLKNVRYVNYYLLFPPPDLARMANVHSAEEVIAFWGGTDGIKTARTWRFAHFTQCSGPGSLRASFQWPGSISSCVYPQKMKGPDTGQTPVPWTRLKITKLQKILDFSLSHLLPRNMPLLLSNMSGLGSYFEEKQSLSNSWDDQQNEHNMWLSLLKYLFWASQYLKVYIYSREKCWRYTRNPQVSFL